MDDFAEVQRRYAPTLDKVIYEGLLDYKRVCAREFTGASSMDSIQDRRVNNYCERVGITYC